MSQDYRPSVVSLIGHVIDGKYAVLSILGEGGMGAVYRAQTSDGAFVAVKVLHQELGDNAELKERFQREIQALFALRHPNILAAHDAGVVDGSPYLVMELLDGLPLDKYVEDQAPDPAVAIGIVRQILGALAFAHARGAAHRDLKAENVFLQNTPNGPVAKLLDFGLVKFTDEAKWGANRKLTVQGSVFGTPAYMAPEQALGQNTDTRTDVYSAGCILFELLTGEWPFMEETQMQMLQAHMTRPPRLVADTRLEIAVRPQVEDVIQKAMAKKPEDRFNDAGEMLAALDAIPAPIAMLRPADGSDPFRVRGVPAGRPSATTIPYTPPAAAEPNRAVLLGIAAVVGVLVVAALAVLFF